MYDVRWFILNPDLSLDREKQSFSWHPYNVNMWLRQENRYEQIMGQI